jgi:hypothetical protein
MNLNQSPFNLLCWLVLIAIIVIAILAIFGAVKI